MVPAQNILDRAKAENADLIGLSGLITPSLEEMGHVAREMQRQGFTIPLLIGGATTSRAHTALKIDPHYKSPTVWVKDASRAVGVAQSLISQRTARAVRGRQRMPTTPRSARATAIAATPSGWCRWRRRARSASMAAGPTTRRRRRASPASPCSTTTRWPNWSSSSTGRRSSMPGNWPARIRRSSTMPWSARRHANCSATRRRCCRQIVDEKWLTAKAVFGLWPANSVGDDVVVDVDGTPTTLHFLRQQVDKPVERPDFCLADFIAPKESGKQDWIGAFAVTAGIGIEPHVARFEADHDDYNAIMLKALADRLAEALAERLHQRVRKEFWGYAADEALDSDALIAEKYRGIRPAPGYPACPEHSEKATLFRLLDADRNAGHARSPKASRCIRPPRCPATTSAIRGSQYFVVGRVSKEQAADYAQRKGVTLPQAERGSHRTWTTTRNSSSHRWFTAALRRGASRERMPSRLLLGPPMLDRPVAMHQRPFGMFGQRRLAERAQDLALCLGALRRVQRDPRIAVDAVHEAVLLDQFLVGLAIGVGLAHRGDQRQRAHRRHQQVAR